MIKKLMIVVFTLIICLGIGGSVFYFYVKPEVKINGKDKIVLNLGDEYKEEGVEAFILKKDVSDDVVVKGNVDTSKVGTYKIEYLIANKFVKNKSSAVRYVAVVDNISPEITLDGSNVSIFVGDNYTEAGYKAIDNYDGDITDKVEVSNNIDNTKIGKYEVKYLVKDSSNNSVEVKREVEVKEKPVVKTSSSTSSKGYGVPVLMYHYFYDASKGETGKNSNWMEISAFEEQMKYLSDNGYYFPSWTELADFVDGKITLPKKSIVVTADDGHSSFFELAVPVVNKYNVKITGFVITNRTGAGTINAYKSDKVNFQTHTHDMHKGGCSGGHGGLFRCINYDKGVNDLTTSVNILGSRDAIAYPFGDVTDNVINVTKAVGVKLGFTTKYGKVYKGMDKLQLPRVRMSKGVSLKGFINAIS